ncbi:LPS export ABC transporter periplasmic protein LptC [Oxalobacteraceae bacterium OM1]|nr:LPS export ABC transporter periplasmic protein LptC [Oxalobacteraceae bacterium OM1]
MNRPRRFRVLVVLAPLIALALGSFWLMEVMRRSTEDIVPTAQRTEPDFYVERFSYVKMSPRGQPQYHFSGARLTHDPIQDTYEIRDPQIRTVDMSHPPTTLRAEVAKVNSDNSEVRLFRNVQLDRPATPDSEHLHVASEYMLLLPDDDIVRTDKPVQMSLGTATLNGTGMYANNATRELRLASNVHGTYQPPAR